MQTFYSVFGDFEFGFALCHGLIEGR